MNRNLVHGQSVDTDLKQDLVTEDNAVSKAENSDEKAQRKRLIKGCLITLAGAMCWGANATMSKYMFQTYDVDPLWMVCLRQLGASICFLLASYITTRSQLKAALSNKRDFAGIIFVGIFGITLLNLSYVVSIDVTNSATTTVLQTLATVLVLIYTCLRFKRTPKPRESIGVILALVGTFLLATGGNPGKLELPLNGLFWGLSTAFGAALLTILPVKLLDKYGSFVVNGLAMFIVGIPLALIIQPWTIMPALDGFGVFLCVLVVVFGSFGGYALFLEGAKLVGSMRASLIGAAEPLMAIICSMAFMGAVYSPAEFLGFFLIIIMIFLTA